MCSLIQSQKVHVGTAEREALYFLLTGSCEGIACKPSHYLAAQKGKTQNVLGESRAEDRKAEPRGGQQWDLVTLSGLLDPAVSEAVTLNAVVIE